MRCDRKVGLREKTGAKNNRPKAAMGEGRRRADPTETWGYAAASPPRAPLNPQLWQGAPVTPQRRGLEGTLGVRAVAETSAMVSRLGHGPVVSPAPRGDRAAARGAPHPPQPCLRAHRLDYISLFPSRLEHRKPLCHPFTLGLHWYLINSIKQVP